MFAILSAKHPMIEYSKKYTQNRLMMRLKAFGRTIFMVFRSNEAFFSSSIGSENIGGYKTGSVVFPFWLAELVV